MGQTVERMLTGDLNHHLGYEKHEVAGYNSGNSRNGKSTKTLKGEASEMEIDVPRDRNGSFEPQAIEAVFPNTLVQICIVHLIRASPQLRELEERKSVAADLKSIYRPLGPNRPKGPVSEFRRKYPKHQVVADAWELLCEHSQKPYRDSTGTAKSLGSW